MSKLFGKVLAGATVALALFAWTSQAEAFHHRWHGSSGGWGSSGGYGGSSGSWGSSGGSSGWYGGSSGGWGGSSGGSSGGWHHGHHKHWRGGSSGSWGSSGGSSGSWGSSGGSSGGTYYYTPMPGVIDPATVPPAGAPVAPAPGAAPAPAPAPAPGTPTGMSKSDGLLTVSVPDDAKIFVNGQPTTSTGAARQYVSRDLASGYNYAYEVRAEVVRDGKTIEQLKTVNVRAGETASLAFDFPATESSETSLTVHVPSDAKVFLAGNATKASGETRVFRTTGLTDGKSWEGYTVRVELERGGRVLTKEETISLKAGESRELVFDFEGDKVASSR